MNKILSIPPGGEWASTVRLNYGTSIGISADSHQFATNDQYINSPFTSTGIYLHRFINFDRFLPQSSFELFNTYEIYRYRCDC